jgi:hypothetical protein
MSVKDAMPCYLDFLFLEKAVSVMNVIYPCREKMQCRNCLLEQIAIAITIDIAGVCTLQSVCIYLVCNVDNCFESKSY